MVGEEEARRIAERLEAMLRDEHLDWVLDQVGEHTRLGRLEEVVEVKSKYLRHRPLTQRERLAAIIVAMKRVVVEFAAVEAHAAEFLSSEATTHGIKDPNVIVFEPDEGDTRPAFRIQVARSLSRPKSVERLRELLDQMEGELDAD